MAEQIVEITYVPIVPGTDLSAGDAKDIWDETLKTISSQSGFKSMYWGRQIENPDTVQLAIEWESHNDHKKFIDSPIYQPFLARVKPILTGAPKIFHVKLAADLPLSVPFGSPITECMSLWLEPDFDNATYDASFRAFADAAYKVPNVEASGLTGGWGIEEQKHANFGPEGEEGPAKLFGVFIGWPSVESHMEFRKSEHFPGVQGHMRVGPKAVAVHHTAFKKY